MHAAPARPATPAHRPPGGAPPIGRTLSCLRGGAEATDAR